MSLLLATSLPVLPTTYSTSHHNYQILPRRNLQTSSSRPPYSITNHSSIFTSTTPRCSSSSMATVTEAPSSLQFQGSLMYSRAYWVTRSLIAWNIDIGDGSCYLYSSRDASLALSDVGIEGYDLEIKLEPNDSSLPVNVIEKFPHIQDCRGLKVPQSADVKDLLKCQLAVAFFTGEN
ncbi:hypothetical protein GIB67_017183 [Kingdonia uniflora]|uniref:Pullulanase N2 domain-containing protein n=1 Tax=Kingdonia uniflora TaxID=39325 RepID=A0A7J7NL76_9MAGN|nr:hypothetical protein GIB67_017183 [Kingdonia uniflora]